MKYLIGLSIVFILVIAACDKSAIMDSEPEVTDVDDMTAAINEFQWELFREVMSQSNVGENVCVSPLSVASALYMTLQGAEGNTRSEMERVLALGDLNGDDLGASYAELVDLLVSTTGNTRLQIENALFWDDQRITPKETFLQYTQSHFNTEQYGLDFQNDVNTLQVINDWVSQATEQRIDKIIEEISPEEVMFLINALFFTSDWANPFPVEGTRNEAFTLTDGTVINVPMMFQDSYSSRFSRETDYDAIELAMVDSSYSMTFIIPTQAQELDQFINEFSHQEIDNLHEMEMTSGRAHILLPRFSVSHSVLLNDILREMGMLTAFDPNDADFSRLGTAPEGNLFISKVNHKTYVKVDEKGVEGAAVTSVGVGVTSLPPRFIFDRPFMFMLRNRATNTLIFVGKVENPLAED